MKKFIIAALSMVVGAFGYTITDKVIDERVATLESQVVSLEQLHQNNAEIVIPSVPSIPTTTPITSPDSNNSVKLGDALKFTNNQRYEFNIRCLSYSKKNPEDSYNDFYRIYDIDYNSDYDFESVTSSNFGSSAYNVTTSDHKVDITKLNAVVSRDEKIEETEKYNYTTRQHLRQEHEITLTIEGKTSPELANKELKFDIQLVDEDYYGTILSTTSSPALICEDGTFSLIYKITVNYLNCGYMLNSDHKLYVANPHW